MIKSLQNLYCLWFKLYKRHIQDLITALIRSLGPNHRNFLTPQATTTNTYQWPVQTARNPLDRWQPQAIHATPNFIFISSWYRIGSFARFCSSTPYHPSAKPPNPRNPYGYLYLPSENVSCIHWLVALNSLASSLSGSLQCRKHYISRWRFFFAF